MYNGLPSHNYPPLPSATVPQRRPYRSFWRLGVTASLIAGCYFGFTEAREICSKANDDAAIKPYCKFITKSEITKKALFDGGYYQSSLPIPIVNYGIDVSTGQTILDGPQINPSPMLVATIRTLPSAPKSAVNPITYDQTKFTLELRLSDKNRDLVPFQDVQGALNYVRTKLPVEGSSENNCENFLRLLVEDITRQSPPTTALLNEGGVIRQKWSTTFYDKKTDQQVGCFPNPGSSTSTSSLSSPSTQPGQSSTTTFNSNTTTRIQSPTTTIQSPTTTIQSPTTSITSTTKGSDL